LRGEAAADLVVIGGGFTGLWTALLAKESFPERSVVLAEGHRVGWAASGRNGGFCDASLTHSAVNGRARFPGEFGTLQRLGAQNLDAIEAAVDRHGIDCDFERAVPSGSPPRNTRSTGSARPPTATAARSLTPEPCAPR
jgi:glycine/D-amino acid oxidase-like deaminating enzyme